jgi:arabinofuranan 3-O-arabinosyltransferase
MTTTHITADRLTDAAGHGLSRTGSEGTTASTRRWRMRYAAVCLVLVTVCLNTDSGRVAPDTKLDLTMAPGKFLARALTLWDAQGFAGQLQNQAYGYLFPMGPFFWLGHAVGMPAWAVQRLWWSALLCAAFLGLVVLAGRMGIGSPLSRLIGGAAYATTPHVVTLLGSNSIEALPTCVAPWVLVPLVGPAAIRTPRRAAALSGVAVLCLGGVNAAAASAALVPAALWLLFTRPVRQALRLGAWWLAAIVLATFWWVGPLLLLGRYSPPFLDYIESAGTTTQMNSLLESLRGTSDWVPYLPGSGWHAGWLLLVQPALVLNSVVVVAIGVVGLVMFPRVHRGYLLTCLCVGLLILTFGHAGGVHGDYAGWAHGLLNGALAPLRNLHKFDLVIRLPLVLGLIHAIESIRWGAVRAERHASGLIVSAVVVVAVIGTAAPLVALKANSSGSYPAIPAYWRQTASWLGEQHATGRSLLIPSSRFATYDWGRPPDEPLQPLAASAWEVRNAIPLVPPGHIRMLNAVEAQLDSGDGSPGLADYLARSGIEYLVVRNDLDYGAGGTTRPVIVHAALAQSPGLTRVAEFGPRIGVDSAFGVTVDQHIQLPYPAVEVWKVNGPADERVSLAPANSLTEVAGGSESLLPLITDGIVGSAPTVLAGDAGSALASSAVLTDGMRRREVDFGGNPSDQSATLSASDDGRLGAAARDYLPRGGSGTQSSAVLIGAKAISASSSAADADALPGAPVAPIEMPYSAFDDDPATSWMSNLGAKASGQWIQIDFASPRAVSDLSINLPTTTGRVRELTATTATGSVTTQTTGSGEVALPAPPGLTPFLRITFTRVESDNPYAQVGIREVHLPGLKVRRTIDVDLHRASAVSAIDFSAAPGARQGCVLVTRRPVCAVGLTQLGEDNAAVDRTFRLGAGGTYTPAVTATPRAGSHLDALIAKATGSRLRLAASSQAVPGPLAGAAAAMDGDLGSGWIASPNDSSPTLTLTFPARVRLSSLTVAVDQYLAGTRPDSVTITSGSRSQVVPIDQRGRASFHSIMTRQVRLSFSNSGGLAGSYDPTSRTYKVMGMGISELRLPGIHAASRASTDPKVVQLPCGSGPTLRVDGEAIPTWATTNVARLRGLSPVTFRPCGSGSAITLVSGQHNVVLSSTPEWTAAGIVLRGDSPAKPSGTAAGTAEVRQWGSTSRAVQLGARGADSVLVVHENVNAGWEASLDGVALRPVTIDGWQQGYLVPAGRAGVVTIEFGPQRPFRAALLLGVIGICLLALLAAIPGRARTTRRSTAASGRFVVPVLGLGTAVAIAGTVIGCLMWLGVYMLAWAIAVSFGPSGWDRQARTVLAGALLLVPGVNLAVHHWPAIGYAGNTNTAALMCLAAVLLMTVPRPPRPKKPRVAAARSRAPGGVGASPAVPPGDMPTPLRGSTGPSP